MRDDKATIESLKTGVRKFISSREWEKYHNPKDLAISLSLESAELMEIFQWMDEEEMQEQMATLMGRIEEELADIAIYVLSFCSTLDIDLSEIVTEKLKKNEEKYPVDLYKGKASL